MPTYPVKWKGRDYTMTDVTVGMKRKFCEELVQRLKAEAIEEYRRMPTVLNAYLDGLKSRVWWVARGMSAAVAEFIKSPDGNLIYNRMLFGESVKGMTDDELQALIDDKEREQQAANDEADAAGFKASEDNPYPSVNDYMLALDAIHASMGPKAPAPATSGSAPTGTPSTGSS